MEVVILDPNRSMVLSFREGDDVVFSWAFGLYQESPDRTRLITRLRAQNMHPAGRILWDLGEIFMMRKCMLGIKERVEAGSGSDR